jgi:hypothetical protein
MALTGLNQWEHKNLLDLNYLQFQVTLIVLEFLKLPLAQQ